MDGYYLSEPTESPGESLLDDGPQEAFDPLAIYRGFVPQSRAAGDGGRSAAVAKTDGAIERAAFAGAAADLPTEREHLRELATQRIAGKKDREHFAEDMQRFEERAGRQKLSDAEVAGTFKQIARLLEVDGDQFIDKKAKVMVAQQVMRQAADPTRVDSGFHKTCNVTAVEARTFTRYPATAARLVADVSVGGTFTAADGTVIKANAASLKPDDEALWTTPRDGARSLASQIFQVTAVNVFWQRQTRDAAGHPVAKGALQYEQMATRNKPADTGERLLDYTSGVGVEMRDRKNNLLRQPFMRTNDVVEVSNQITGLTETDVLLENAYKPDPGFLTRKFSTVDGLKDELVRMKANSRLPVVLTVHTGNKPFSGDSGGTGSAGVWHVLTVTDIDEKTGKVSVDNQWGTRKDHIGKDGVDVAVLFKATLAPGMMRRNGILPVDPLDKVVVGAEN